MSERLRKNRSHVQLPAIAFVNLDRPWSAWQQCLRIDLRLCLPGLALIDRDGPWPANQLLDIQGSAVIWPAWKAQLGVSFSLKHQTNSRFSAQTHPCPCPWHPLVATTQVLPSSIATSLCMRRLAVGYEVVPGTLVERGCPTRPHALRMLWHGHLETSQHEVSSYQQPHYHLFDLCLNCPRPAALLRMELHCKDLTEHPAIKHSQYFLPKLLRNACLESWPWLHLSCCSLQT
mmetsp:Transcript_29862/g.55896  ORF Transcript_29862/g.55896 Transcript_29862/m.55896 type:complete len:232 (-) Transcript_29862:2362-3057(-)